MVRNQIATRSQRTRTDTPETMSNSNDDAARQLREQEASNTQREPPSVADRLQEILAENKRLDDELALQRALQEREAKRRALQSMINPETIATPTPLAIRNESSDSSERRRLLKTLGTPKMKATTHEITRRDIDDYLYLCTTYFEAGGDDLADDAKRVLLAQAGLDQRRQRKWREFLADTKGDMRTTTWEEFRDWFISLLPIGYSRDINTSHQIALSKQKPGQSVEDFADKLEVLEDELTTRPTESQRVHNLFMGLNENLKNTILPTLMEIRTRDDLLAKCKMLENYAYPSNPVPPPITQPASLRPSFNHRPELVSTPQRAPNGPYTGEKRKTIEEIQCYNCFDMGHYASRCTQPKRCRKCKQLGHTWATCPSSDSAAPPRGSSSASGSNSTPVSDRRDDSSSVKALYS